MGKGQRKEIENPGDKPGFIVLGGDMPLLADAGTHTKTLLFQLSWSNVPESLVSTENDLHGERSGGRMGRNQRNGLSHLLRTCR